MHKKYWNDGAKTLLNSLVTIAGLVACPTTSYGQELRAAFTPLCPTSKSGDRILESPAFIGAIISTFAGKLVDTSIQNLKKVVSPDTSTIEVSFLQDGLYSYTDVQPGDASDKKNYQTKFNTNKQCLVIAVGKFGAKPTDWVLPFDTDDSKKDEAWKNITSVVPLVEAPDLYFEAIVYSSNDKTAVTWKPVRLYVGKHINNSFWAGRSRSIQLTFGMTKPGISQPFYSQSLKFDNISVPFLKTPAEFELSGAQGTWGALPPPSSATPKIAADVGRGAPFDPFTLTVQLVEYPKPYKLAAAFVDSVDLNNGAIKTSVDQVLDPTKKETANQTAETQTLAAITSYAAAWKTAKAVCDTANTSDAPGKLACQTAKDTLMIASEKADMACKFNSVSSCQNLDLGTP